jgi:glycosyltransferase involved in cell wall biosynthesis
MMDQGRSQNKSVVLVSQFFHPDTSANSTLLSELAVGLAERGVDVSVITTQPSYTEEDRNRNEPKSEMYEGVSIRRLPATRFDRNAGLAQRMLNELSFFIVALIYLCLRRRGDVVLVPTAPSFLPVAAWPLRLRGYKPVPIVMDLYPGMAVALEYIHANSPVRQVWEWLNKRAYHRAEVTVTIGETMADQLRKEYGEIPIEVIHNWEDGEFITPVEKSENPFAQKHGFTDQFTLLYSGNLGRHHDLESIVEAAEKLEHDEDVPPFEIIFIGEGGQKQQLQTLVEDRSIDSVRFLPYQPVEELPNSLTSADVSIVTMAQGVEGLCVSSKFYTALASGQAVLSIAAPDAEIAHVVEEIDCGIHVDPESPDDVAAAVRRWINNPALATEMGDKARDVFEASFSKDVAVDQYYELIRSI